VSLSLGVVLKMYYFHKRGVWDGYFHLDNSSLKQVFTLQRTDDCLGPTKYALYHFHSLLLRVQIRVGTDSVKLTEYSVEQKILLTSLWFDRSGHTSVALAGRR
jgi:hypothetical protein